MRVKDAIDRYLDSLEGVYSPLTISKYGRCLRAFEPIERKQLHNVRIEDLDGIWSTLVHRRVLYDGHPMRIPIPGKLSPYTLHGYVRSWRTFFHWCVKRQYIRQNPALLLKKPKLPKEEPKAVTYDDLVRMLEAAKDFIRDLAVLCFLADTGCRVGGLAHLVIKDLDLDRGRAKVREKG